MLGGLALKDGNSLHPVRSASAALKTSLHISPPLEYLE
jgi:hypothetical protein